MRRIALTTLIVLAIVIVATSSVMAHVSVRDTTLSIQLRGGPVDQGETVSIVGVLRGAPSCRAGQDIDLVRTGAGVISTTTTDAAGRFRFTFVATEDQALQARFSGSMSGVHPHSHLCAGSRSRTLRVDVRGTGDVLGGGDTSVPGVGDGTALSGRDIEPFALAVVALLTLGVISVLAARHRASTRNVAGGRADAA